MLGRDFLVFDGNLSDCGPYEYEYECDSTKIRFKVISYEVGILKIEIKSNTSFIVVADFLSKFFKQEEKLQVWEIRGQYSKANIKKICYIFGEIEETFDFDSSVSTIITNYYLKVAEKKQEKYKI
ncbi:MAG: hypothetical protein N2749_05250 [Clostridia bacterium]|nr:hypothetical protein [Clostridia bacterium]